MPSPGPDSIRRPDADWVLAAHRVEGGLPIIGRVRRRPPALTSFNHCPQGFVNLYTPEATGR
jgi:hypothetical protein